MRGTVGGEDKQVHDATENFEIPFDGFLHVIRCVVVGGCTDTGGRPNFVLLVAVHGWGLRGALHHACVFDDVRLFNVIVNLYVENVVALAKHDELLSKTVRLQDGAYLSRKVRELLEFIASAKNAGTEVKILIS